jgi:hypothetical protein
VVVAIWNGLLFLSLALVIKYRKRILARITELDRVNRDGWTHDYDDNWRDFLTNHPELLDHRGRCRGARPERRGACRDAEPHPTQRPPSAFELELSGVAPPRKACYPALP